MREWYVKTSFSFVFEKLQNTDQYLKQQTLVLQVLSFLKM